MLFLMDYIPTVNYKNFHTLYPLLQKVKFQNFNPFGIGYNNLKNIFYV